MSRHNISLPSSTMPNTKADVVVGFDQAQNHFFCHAVSQWGGILYSSGLDLAHKGAQDPNEFIEPLSVVGIALPQSVLDNVRLDKQGEASEANFYYESDGTPTNAPVGVAPGAAS